MLKTYSRKALSVLFSLALIVSLFAGLMITASAASGNWTDSGNYSTTWYTTGGPTDYTITTAADIAGLAAIANGTASGITQDSFSGKTITLAANASIDLDAHYWIPIGQSVSFKGTFNGNYRTISNLVISLSGGNDVGLFGKLEVGALVNNLTIADATVSGARGVGIFVGRSWGTVNNCHTDGGTVSSTDSRGVGGIVGAHWVSYGATPPTISNCSNSANITCTYSSGSAGGIAGENEGSIYNCWNTGIITCTTYNAGGIAGSNKNNYSIKEDIGGDVFGGVANCYNTGAISGKYAGGICGFNQGSCQNVYNIGTVSDTNNGYAGQIIGDMNVTNGNLVNEPWYIAPETDPIGYYVAGAYDYDDLVDLSTADDLLDSLNDWVDNEASPPYSYWDIGASGYPVLS